jgi:hypothetical protein
MATFCKVVSSLTSREPPEILLCSVFGTKTIPARSYDATRSKYATCKVSNLAEARWACYENRTNFT